MTVSPTPEPDLVKSPRAIVPRNLALGIERIGFIALSYRLISIIVFVVLCIAATVGFARLKVFHLNDSKKPLGSRVDRHEHIGQGHLGLEPFRRIVNDPRFRDVPMLLETPKTEGRAPKVVAVDPLDERNLNALRALVARRSGRPLTHLPG